MKFRSKTLSIVAVGALWIGFAVALMAQEKTTTQVTPGASSVATQVDRAEVVYVSGNDLVVKMENGEVRHLTVPDNVKATVDGKELTVHDLKPGMKLQRTITTTTTAKTVRTVRTVSGRVFQVSAPRTVILSMADGTNKQYQIPKDQVFMIDGEKKTAFDLRPGMNVTANVITEVPEVQTTEQRVITGTAPPPPKPTTPPPQIVLLIEMPVPAPVPTAAARPAPAPQTPEPPPAQLPKTASPAPLLGLIGLLFVGASLSLRVLRNRG
jgi:hypothetical protein